jgi:hypothetical protein
MNIKFLKELFIEIIIEFKKISIKEYLLYISIIILSLVILSN